jgi:hypothetical protein
MTGVATRDNPPVRADDSPASPADVATSGLATSANQTAANATLAALQTLLAGGLPSALSAGRLMVESTGNIASGATDTGNPVKVGGVYRTSPSVLTNGQRGDFQIDANSNQKVVLATLIAGEDQTFDRLKTMLRFSPTNIAAATTTLVKSGAGVLHSITINTTAAGTITIWDSLTASGTKIGTIKASVVEQTFVFDCAFATGLTIVTAGASDITVNWI